MIYGLGFGARSALLSLVTSWIDPECTGTLYSAVFLLEEIGMLGGEPLIQNLLGIAVGLPDPWKGLPFICASVSFQPALPISNFYFDTQPLVILFHDVVSAFAITRHIG